MSSDRLFDAPDRGAESAPESSNGGHGGNNDGAPGPRVSSGAPAEPPVFNTAGRTPGGESGYGGSYGAALDMEAASSEGLNIRYVLGVLVKRRWSALTVLLMALTYVVIQNYTAVSVFQATARVLVETERFNLVDIEAVIEQRRSLDAELAILRSRWLAKRTVEALGLLPSRTQTVPQDGTEATEVGDVPSDSSLAWWSSVQTFASKAFGIGSPPASSEGSQPGTGVSAESSFGESLADIGRINGFLGGLSVSFTSQASTVLDVTYRSSDPIVAAHYANTHADQYIEQSLDLRFAAVQEVTDWLGDRLAEQRLKVDASEQALSQFREENGLTAIEGSSPTVTRLNQLTTSLTSTQAELLEMEARHNTALALRGDPERFDQLPLTLGNETLQRRRLDLEQLQRRRVELSATLRDRHPDMVQLREALEASQIMLETERDRLLESLRQEIAASEAAEANLARALDTLKQEAIIQGSKSVQLSVHMREAETNRQIYNLLLERAQETDVAKEINPSRARVLDQAVVPGSPFTPNRVQNLQRGFLAGLVLAIAVAFGFERLDNSVRAPGDISDYLQLPYIGLLPEVTVNDKSVRLLATDGVLPQFTEELRQIRTNVLFSFSGSTARSVVITSAGPGEGKTVVASNLAVALAQTGERVLLVDADLRRPRVHSTFSVSQQPGLTNVLVGNTKLSQAVQESGVANLWILPAGRHPPNPSELLGSQKLKSLLTVLGEEFTWILFDTPPVIAVTDACVLGHVVSGVLFIAGSEKVSRQLARRAIEQIKTANGKLVGGVLNRVAISSNRYYYASYSATYQRKYGDYYRTPKPPPPVQASSDGVSNLVGK